MLYTVISQYDVCINGFALPQFVDVNGGKVEYTLQGNNKIITSLFSTDPKMYLNKKYTPGQILDK